MQLEIKLSIPDCLKDEVGLSGVYENFGASGNATSFGFDLDFYELDLRKEFKSKDLLLLEGQVQATLSSWEAKYLRHQLGRILPHALDCDATVDWNSLKRSDSFKITPKRLIPEDSIRTAITVGTSGLPTDFRKADPPDAPDKFRIQSREPLWVRLFSKKTIDQKYTQQLDRWKEQIKENEAWNQKLEQAFEKSIEEFKRRKNKFDKKKAMANAPVDAMEIQYKQGNPEVIEDYCHLVLNASDYPKLLPKTSVLEYREPAQMLIVERDLPAPSGLPSIESCRFVASENQIKEKPLTASAKKRLFNDVVYQICLRTIHELFEADVVGALESICFNGKVTEVNPATGVSETKTILSVLAKKEEFVELDLSRVDPKATFKHLKGVAATNLIDLAPIPPVVTFDKTDERFVEGRSVVKRLDDSVNLAAMDWEDFEHLVRELFQQEFGRNGGEVRVTQASADGGVDAIAFDPDPIRGGKIVIQAKRYTNTVGVSAVRDLYGTVMNEGATKGILVTTSNFGGDSHDFVKDKPLSLINGNHLLSLLERHGHRARINLQEAKDLAKD